MSFIPSLTPSKLTIHENIESKDTSSSKIGISKITNIQQNVSFYDDVLSAQKITPQNRGLSNIYSTKGDGSCFFRAYLAYKSNDPYWLQDATLNEIYDWVHNNKATFFNAINESITSLLSHSIDIQVPNTIILSLLTSNFNDDFGTILLKEMMCKDEFLLWKSEEVIKFFERHFNVILPSNFINQFIDGIYQSIAENLNIPINQNKDTYIKRIGTEQKGLHYILVGPSNLFSSHKEVTSSSEQASILDGTPKKTAKKRTLEQVAETLPESKLSGLLIERGKYSWKKRLISRHQASVLEELHQYKKSINANHQYLLYDNRESMLSTQDNNPGTSHVNIPHINSTQYWGEKFQSGIKNKNNKLVYRKAQSNRILQDLSKARCEDSLIKLSSILKKNPTPRSVEINIKITRIITSLFRKLADLTINKKQTIQSEYQAQQAEKSNSDMLKVNLSKNELKNYNQDIAALEQQQDKIKRKIRRLNRKNLGLNLENKVVKLLNTLDEDNYEKTRLSFIFELVERQKDEQPASKDVPHDLKLINSETDKSKPSRKKTNKLKHLKIESAAYWKEKATNSGSNKYDALIFWKAYTDKRISFAVCKRVDLKINELIDIERGIETNQKLTDLNASKRHELFAEINMLLEEKGKGLRSNKNAIKAEKKPTERSTSAEEEARFDLEIKYLISSEFERDREIQENVEKITLSRSASQFRKKILRLIESGESTHDAVFQFNFNCEALLKEPSLKTKPVKKINFGHPQQEKSTESHAKEVPNSKNKAAEKKEKIQHLTPLTKQINIKQINIKQKKANIDAAKARMRIKKIIFKQDYPKPSLS